MSRRIGWEKLLVWLLLAAVGGLGVGQLAAWVGGYIRPVLLFPLLVGSLLGGILVFWIRLVDLADRGRILMGIVVAGAVCVGSEHLGYYWQAQQDYERLAFQWRAKTEGLAALSSQWAQAIQQQLPPPPGSFREYLVRQGEQGRRIGPWMWKGAWVWISWIFEAALVLAATGAVVWPTLRWPFCWDCESWYRTVRQGRLLAHDLPPWAEAFQIPIFGPEGLQAVGARFRLLQCGGQCTPGRLELNWESPDGTVHRWQNDLDAPGRQKLQSLWQRTFAEEESPPPKSAEVSHRCWEE